MGASWSSEWRSGCCCCCVDSKRRAVEIGDGTLGEKLLDASEQDDAVGDEMSGKEDGEKRGKTVVDDAWLLQVEETRRAASGREARASRGSSEGDGDGDEEEDEQQGDGRKTAWDLSDEGENEEEEHDEEEEAASQVMSGENDDEGLAESGTFKADSASRRRSERFSSRSTKDSYASVTDHANSSMLFRESLEGASAHYGNAPDDEDDGGDAEVEECDDDDGDAGGDR